MKHLFSIVICLLVCLPFYAQNRIVVSKKQMTKEALKLKKDLQEIYKTYDLPFSQTSLTDIFSSNPQKTKNYILPKG